MVDFYNRILKYYSTKKTRAPACGTQLQLGRMEPGMARRFLRTGMVRFFCKITTLCAVTAALVAPVPIQAQQLNTVQGLAPRIDMLQTARDVSMRDMYNRSLYLFIRSNPAVLDDQQFYVNFLIFLMMRSQGFDCRQAFSDEFERRDFFTNAFALKDQLRQIVNSVRIPERFDIAYTIDTGRYDFTTGNLPFDRRTAIGLREQLSQSINSDSQDRSCASQILNGTNVDHNAFAWRFDVVNEAGERWTPTFPFGGSLTLSDADARVLFERFGRQLYSVVSFQFLAANNGEQKIRIVPTDGQLFGLASDAVVRVKSYGHPQLSQPSYLDVTNPLAIELPKLKTALDVTFEQDGFRAVAKGTRTDAGTGITSATELPVTGSAAVGNSVFIMRFAMPDTFKSSSGYNNSGGGDSFLTLFGSVDFEKLTATTAPVSGLVQVLEQDPNQPQLKVADRFNFQGVFRPAGAEPEAEAAPEPATQLD
jgi:hypothetical protein